MPVRVVAPISATVASSTVGAQRTRRVNRVMVEPFRRRHAAGSGGEVSRAVVGLTPVGDLSFRGQVRSRDEPSPTAMTNPHYGIPPTPTRTPTTEVVRWRMDRLRAAGFAEDLALALAGEGDVDLHALL